MGESDLRSLLCPLCGKNTSLTKYDPESFDMDVYVQDFRGLGRGKGFVSLGRRSILHDRAALGPLVKRVVDLVELLHDEGDVDDDKLRERLWPYEDEDEADLSRAKEDLSAMKAGGRKGFRTWGRSRTRHSTAFDFSYLAQRALSICPELSDG